MPINCPCKIIPLTDLPTNIRAEIVKLEVADSLKRRLLDLGFIPGTKIEVAFSSPLGDPRAYYIRDTLLALRANEAKYIMVRRLNQ